jgi:anti-sigma regulatory factor (Ser/Thr protein kinase)
VLVLYTDGLVERRDESIDAGMSLLAAEVAAGSDSVSEIADSVLEKLRQDDSGDDVALVALGVDHAVRRRISVSFPAEPRSLASIRNTFRTWLREGGAEEDEVFDILVAVSEACANAIEHPLARPAGTPATVGLEGEIVDGDISIVIRDGGTWRPETVGQDRGRGIEFMKALMDATEVTRLGDGTVVRLRRKLRAATAS